MSADLFAEFGFQAPQQQQQQQQRSDASRESSLVPGVGPSSAEPDLLPAEDSDNLSWSEFQTADQNVVGDSLDANNHNPAITQSANASSRKHDDNVLFDATTETLANEEDEWGEFEAPETVPEQTLPTEKSTHQVHGSSNRPGGSAVPPHTVNLIDSLSIEDEGSSSSKKGQQIPAVTPGTSSKRSKPSIKKRTDTHKTNNTAATPNDSFFDEWDDLFPKKNSNNPPQKSEAEISSDQFFDEFDDFVTGKPPEEANAGSLSSKSGGQKKSENKLQNQTSSSEAPQLNKPAAPPPQIRPTNIPPPAVLLELLPQLFEKLQEEASLLKDPQQKASLDNAAVRISRTLKVAARVIAGRALRWKRDTILSQSMRIGPARGGKPGGMKLNTVNKSENVKEKQEALDAIGAWRHHSGVFNSVMLSSGRERPIQPIAENARAITASPEKGALKAPHACAVCGLKRDERILGGIDDNVEDSFGEFWTEHWGHTDCRLFWESNRKLLNQR